MATAVPIHVCLRRHCHVTANSQSDRNYTETIQARHDGRNSGNAGGTPLFSRVIRVQSNRAFGLDWSTTSAGKTDGRAPVKLQPVRGAQPFPVVDKPAPVPSAPPFPVFNKQAPVPSAPIVQQPRVKPHLV